MDIDCSDEGDETIDVESETTKMSESDSGTDPPQTKTIATKKKKQKKKKPLGVNTSSCRYESVRRVTKRFGMKECRDDDEWVLYWMDTSATMERLSELKRFQKINHFPGMCEICRKDFLARNINRMQKLFPKDYNFTPRTWCLPADYADLLAFCGQSSKKNKLFISKPPTGSQGKGIFITRNVKELKAGGEHVVVQQYLSKPFTIDGFKMDFRIYVLVTQCDPLHVFVYKDGLGRFATHKYSEPTSSNLDDVYLHLTNYSLNKFSDDFVRDDECGSKRRISTVNAWMEENGYNVKKMWAEIEDIVIKTLISIHPILKHNYRSCFSSHTKGSACFEILGFDVMLDKKLKPWLLEVNLSPSLHTDAPLDKEIKEGFLMDALRLINLNGDEKRRCQEEDRRKVQERLFQRSKATREAKKEEMQESQTKYEEWLKRYEDKHLGGFRRIYPQNGNEAYYEKFYTDSASLFSETAASKARQLCAKIQREQIESKQRELELCKTKTGKSTAATTATTAEKPSSHSQIRPESPKMMRRMREKRRLVAPSRTAVAAAALSRSDETASHTSVIPSLEPPLNIFESWPIDVDEENHRQGEMKRRDSLVRGLGIGECLARLLGHGYHHSTGPSNQPTYGTKRGDYYPSVTFIQPAHDPGAHSTAFALLPSRKGGAGGGAGSNWTQYRVQGKAQSAQDETLVILPLSKQKKRDDSSLHLIGRSTGSMYQQQQHRLPLQSQTIQHQLAARKSLTIIGSKTAPFTKPRSTHTKGQKVQ